MKIFLKFFLLLLISANSASAQNIASINPIYQILLAITEDKNNSILIINPGNSEHNYSLKKNDIAAFNKANLIFYVDDSLENKFPKIIKNLSLQKKSYQLSKINSIKLLQRRNNHKKLDPHIWLNLKNGIKIAQFMTQKLCESDQKNCKKYQRNFEKFERDAFQTDKVIRAQLTKMSDSGYVFYHDGYQYFEDYFGVKPLKIMSYDNAPELSLKDMREFANLVKTRKVKCVFGEVVDEKNSAMKLAQNYKIKFMILDLIGSKENFSKERNGYLALLLNMVSDMGVCK